MTSIGTLLWPSGVEPPGTNGGMAALGKDACGEGERLACHFTGDGSALQIFSDSSHGLRASTAGQLEGEIRALDDKLVAAKTALAALTQSSGTDRTMHGILP